jgi:K+-sensing histidine kinase KdpD
VLRVFNESNEPRDSAGLGLRIAAQILRVHGLAASAAARAGGGTALCVEWPALDPNLERSRRDPTAA